MNIYSRFPISRDSARLSLTLFLVFWYVMSSTASDSYVHCKMKPGCSSTTQCHPIPRGWNEKGDKIEGHLLNKEFPITCMNNENIKLWKEVQKEIGVLKTENRETKSEYMELKIETMELKLENKHFKDLLDEIQEKHKKDNCPIFYDSKCFLPVLDELVNKTIAQSTCAKKGGQLADIHDRTHFNLMATLIRENYMKGEKVIGLWLGMTYNTMTKKLLMSNGREATYKKWAPGTPTKQFDHTSVALAVLNGSTEYEFMVNGPSSLSNAYPLCEI